MSVPDPLDLHHQGDERVIGVYLLETDDGLALHDCGPSTVHPRAEGAARGARPRAHRPPPPAALAHPPRPRGRRGHARPRAPGPPGARLGDRRAAPRRPERLERSARRLYGDEFDTLWGELAPVPEENVHVVGDDGARPRLLPVAGPRVAPRLLPRPRRHALRRRRGAACASCPTATSCRSPRRRTSTSRPGSGRSTRSSAARRSGSR